MDFKIWIDILGWGGSVAVIAAYGLISSHRLTANSLVYQWLNVLGSIGLIANTYYYRAYPSMLVNVIWVMIGVFALAKQSRYAKAEQP